MRAAHRALAAGVGALLLAGCVDALDAPPAYSAEQCKRALLIDIENGDVVTGAEDLALDRRNGVLFVSAYDRRAVEKAARRRDFLLPEGGLYRVELKDLMSTGERMAPATPIVARGASPGGLRPHGIDFDEASGEISYVNRAYQRINGRWRMTPRVERVGADGAAAFADDSRAACGANDLVARRSGAWVTFDHGACGWRAAIEDVLSLKRAGVSDADGERLFVGARYANGIAPLADGGLALAATREAAILRLAVKTGDAAADADAGGDAVDGDGSEKRAGPRFAAVGSVKLPGGPDNLTAAADGRLIAALHPSLPQLALHRKLGIGRAPSRIVKVDLDSGDVRLLFDDPTGRLYSGATVAVEFENALIVGSATDRGLLVCRSSIDAI